MRSISPATEMERRPVVATGPGDPHPHDGDGSGLTDGLRLSSTNLQNEQLVLKIQPLK